MKLIFYTIALTMLCVVSHSAPILTETDCTVPNGGYEQFLKDGLRILDAVMCPFGPPRHNLLAISTACRALNSSGTIRFINEDEMELIYNRTCDLINSIYGQTLITDCSDSELTLLQCSQAIVCSHMQLYIGQHFYVDAVLEPGKEYHQEWFDCFDNQLQDTIENSTESASIKRYVCDQAWQYCGD